MAEPVIITAAITGAVPENLAQAMLDNGVKPEVEVFDLAMLHAELVKRAA